MRHRCSLVPLRRFGESHAAYTWSVKMVSPPMEFDFISATEKYEWLEICGVHDDERDGIERLI